MSICGSISVFAEDDKTVTITLSGRGNTQNEAQQNALRSAIEQAFGTFISTKTEILNDALVKDEVVYQRLAQLFLLQNWQVLLKVRGLK